MSVTQYSDEAMIHGAINDWAHSMAMKNADAVLAVQVVDPVVFDLVPPLRVAGKALKNLLAWFASWKGPLTFAVSDLVVTVGNDVAFAHGFVHLAGTTTKGGASDLWFRLTLGLTRVDGRWLIAHVHQSVPFQMNGSNKALVNLKP